MITLADAVARIQAKPPAPVLLIDTCSLLDLFRRDNKRFQPRVPAQEIQAAADLLDLLNTVPDVVHLIVPELIPREFVDHAADIQNDFASWAEFHDQNQEWLVEASMCVALALPIPLMIRPFNHAIRFQALASDLLGKAQVLARDQGCLDRAVVRLINKTRPSHKKEMKDSMNLEQCLELSRRLENVEFRKSRVWVSSNTNDFAQAPTSTQLHPDLLADFTRAGLRYFTSFRAAVGQLRAGGELP